MIYAICIVLTFVALSVFHYLGTGKPLLSNYSYLLGMGLPLLFNIKKKEYRNIALTLCLLAIFLRLGWLGILSVGITYSIIYSENKKFLIIFIPLFLVFSLVIAPKVYPRVNTINGDLKSRFTYYELAMSKWNKFWTGEGFRSWSKLPENQPTFNKDGKQVKAWLHTLHSDLLQLAFEFGVIVTIIVAFLVILPLAYIDTGGLFNRTILASYCCLFFQTLTDFPFHRAITGTFAIWIILMMYKQAFFEKGAKE